VKVDSTTDAVAAGSEAWSGRDRSNPGEFTVMIVAE
jgi:hypothetical protein